MVERDSAYEELDKLIKEKIEREEEEKRKAKEEKEKAKAEEQEKKEKEKAKKEAEKEKDKKSKKMEKLGDRLIGNAASAVERKIINSILKKIF